MTANQEKLSYRTDCETAKSLKEAASEEGRSVNNLMDRWVKEKLRNRKERAKERKETSA